MKSTLKTSPDTEVCRDPGRICNVPWYFGKSVKSEKKKNEILIKFSKSLYCTVWKFQKVYSFTFLTKISCKQVSNVFAKEVIKVLISRNNFSMW